MHNTSVNVRGQVNNYQMSFEITNHTDRLGESDRIYLGDSVTKPSVDPIPWKITPDNKSEIDPLISKTEI